MKKGFTMAEALITLTIIGILSALTIPLMMSGAQKYDVLYKSAFQLTEQAVNDMIQDKSTYPNGDLSSPLGTDPNEFCSGFVRRMNTVGTVNCNLSASMNMTTSNGMKWFNLKGNAFPDAGDTRLISIDVNGAKGNQVFQVDVFNIKISKYGKVSPPVGGLEITYIPR